MKYKWFMVVAGLAAILAGFLFGGYGPVMARFFGTGEIPWPVYKNLSIWRLYSFVRVFGALLFGMGVLSLCVAAVKEPAAQKRIALGHFFAYLVVAIASFIQLTALWGTPAASFLSSFLLALACAFGFLGFVELGDTTVRRTSAIDDVSSQSLEEQWKRQIEAAAVQEERNRLARDLHDSIKQQMFSINVIAATAQAHWENDPAAAREALESVRGSAHEAMVEMEAMLQHLRPAPLETVGLVEAIRKQCEALKYRTDANVTTEFSKLPENRRLRPGTQEAVFRIVQEALANIARHARAGNVTVKLYADEQGQSFFVCVEDDGQGYNHAEVSEGMGMANIRERTQEIGGSVKIQSFPGKGTRLTVCVPLAKPAEEEAGRHVAVGILYLLAAFLFICFCLLGSLDAISTTSTALLTSLPFALPFVLLGVSRFVRARRIVRSASHKLDLLHALPGAFESVLFGAFQK